MATTYLKATNQILKELNEVELSSSNFSSAVGIHAFSKDIINRAYFDIVNGEDEWPFLIEGNPEEPFRGSLYIETVIGQQWYLLKDGSTDSRSDFKSVDWESFYLTDFGVLGSTPPHENRRLHYMNEDYWRKFYQDRDNDSITSGNSDFNIPRGVVRSADTRYIGLTPVPDKVYRVYFNAWTVPASLDTYDQEIVIPDRWINVLYARARYYMWQFKESPQQAAFALDEYKSGIKMMRRNLIDPTPDDMTDDRIIYI